MACVADAPAPDTDARTDVPVARTQTKMLERPAVIEGPPVVRLLAVDSNATKRPSALIEGLELSPFTPIPPGGVVMAIVELLRRSRTKICMRPFDGLTVPVVPNVVAPPVKLPADDWNATNWPSVDRLGFVLSAVDGLPSTVALTSRTRFVAMNQTKTFRCPLDVNGGEPEIKLVARDSNTTICPFAEIDALWLSAFPKTPVGLPLTSRVVPVATFVMKIWLLPAVHQNNSAWLM